MQKTINAYIYAKFSKFFYIATNNEFTQHTYSRISVKRSNFPRIVLHLRRVVVYTLPLSTNRTHPTSIKPPLRAYISYRMRPFTRCRAYTHIRPRIVGLVHVYMRTTIIRSPRSIDTSIYIYIAIYTV